VAAESGPCKGVFAVFTGIRPTSEEEDKFLSLGGVVKSGVSKAVTHLIVRDPSTTSNKATRARELGIEIVSYEEFQGWL